ncbi:MAG: OmpA family protein, partial [Prevotellaceae bacterium]|nr:OmpA family protein [Prevotellaceae bacterium]
DGDQIKPNQRVTPIASQGVMKFNFTVNAEYTFSPIWGMYLEYFYNPYGGNARYQNELAFPHKEYITSDGFHFRGMNHELGIGASLNILNLFYNCRSQKWQWYLNAGMSGNLYKMTYHESYLSGDPTAWPTNHFLGEYQGGAWNGIPSDYDRAPGDILGSMPEDKFNGYDYTMSLPIGTSIEWNATRWLAVVANFQYHIRLNSDKFDGSIAGNDNDGGMYAGIGLRWKINSLNRKLYHVRDMAMCQYEQNMALNTVKKLGNRMDSLENRVDSLDKKVDGFEDRIKALEDDMDKLRDSDGDGVPDIRDRNPNTPPNTLVNYWGVPVDDEGEIPENTYHNGNLNNPIANPYDVDENGIPNITLRTITDLPFYGNSTNKPDNRFRNGDPKKPVANLYDLNNNEIPDYKEFGDKDDLDGDGMNNEDDPDIDGDGIPNEQDPTPYGISSYRTKDGRAVVIEYDDDIDGDGIPNEQDPDIDGDGVPNEQDPTPWGLLSGANKNLKPEIADGAYHNGDQKKPIKDTYDVNGDGIPNYRQKGPKDDLNGNGIPNYLDPDIDGDGIPNALDPTPYGASNEVKKSQNSGTSYGSSNVRGGVSYGSNNSGSYGRGNSGSYGRGSSGSSYQPDTGIGYVPTTECSGQEEVYFATGKFILTAVSHTTLANTARKMYACPDAILEIHGYCDEQGKRSNYDNVKLSKSRAKSVKETLIKKYGVDAKRIVVVEGHGAIPGPTIDYLPNRRVDLVIDK